MLHIDLTNDTIEVEEDADLGTLVRLLTGTPQSAAHPDACRLITSLVGREEVPVSASARSTSARGVAETFVVRERDLTTGRYEVRSHSRRGAEREYIFALASEPDGDGHKVTFTVERNGTPATWIVGDRDPVRVSPSDMLVLHYRHSTDSQGAVVHRAVGDEREEELDFPAVEKPRTTSWERLEADDDVE